MFVIDVQKLANKIQLLDEAYRAGNPLVSDLEFDKLKAELVDIDPKNPILLSPGGGVHLLSLGNQPFENWYKDLPLNTEVVVEPKIDGCAVALRYKYGRLVKAWNRKGKDITYAMRKVSNVPQQINLIEQNVEIRGELYGLTGHLNSQRLAAGHMRKKAPDGKGLAFCAFEVMGRDNGYEVDTLQELLCLGFHVCGHVRIRTSVIQKVKILHDDWLDSLIFSRYPTDGLVVKVNSHKLQTELGSGSVAPDWAIAVKEWKDPE
ncbi:MAG: hypothetical protein CBD51_003210 [Flavobacteriales bacterium TMED191]|nr:MAG: hypothetical protein CBD51_003210 [Flavobacteriales bacterium TMED191]